MWLVGLKTVGFSSGILFRASLPTLSTVSFLSFFCLCMYIHTARAHTHTHTHTHTNTHTSIYTHKYRSP